MGVSCAWPQPCGLFLLLVVAPGCSSEGAGAELGWALLPGTKVSDDFMCPFSVRCLVLVPGRTAWAACTLCHLLPTRAAGADAASVLGWELAKHEALGPGKRQQLPCPSQDFIVLPLYCCVYKLGAL